MVTRAGGVTISVSSLNEVLADRAALAAALVAEGHDLLDLLRDARGHLSESDWDDRALVVRIDAVLAAAGESSSVTLDTYSWVIDREVDAP